MVSIANQRRAGFTLIELLIVMAIAGILAGLLNAFLRSERGGIEKSTLADVYSDRGDAALRLIARDARQSPSHPVWSDESLRLTTLAGEAIRYEVDDIDGTQCLVRRLPESENTTILAFDVSRFSVESEPRRLDIDLEFFAMNEGYRVSSTHETSVALPRREQ